MNNKYLLIGGLGFVGKNLSLYLNELGHKTEVIDIKDPNPNDKDFINEQGIKYHKGDVKDIKFLKEIFQNNSFNGVFHLASFVGIKNYISNPEDVIMTTIQGTLNVANSCLENKVHMLFTSTSEVLGKNEEIPWQEDANRVYGSTEIERWSYGSSKGVAEQLILGMAKTKGLSATIIRFFNIYGNYQNPIFVIPKTISNCMNGENPLMYDSGNQTRCFTYVKDALIALEILMKEKKEGIYHIGSNFEHTVEEVISCITRNTNTSLSPKEINTKEMYKNSYEDIERRVPDVTKIMEDIGWQAETTLEEGIIQTVDWVKDNKWWLNLNSNVEV